MGPRFAGLHRTSSPFAARENNPGRGPGHQVRPRLRLSSRNRRTAIPHRRTDCAIIGFAGRIRLANSATATKTGAVRPPAFFRGPDHRHITRRAALRFWNDSPKFARTRVLAPPSTQGTIIFPGFDGGAEWGGAAVDPNRGILYVNANEMPWILTMVETRAKGGGPGFLRPANLQPDLRFLPWHRS